MLAVCSLAVTFLSSMSFATGDQFNSGSSRGLLGDDGECELPAVNAEEQMIKQLAQEMIVVVRSGDVDKIKRTVQQTTRQRKDKLPFVDEYQFRNQLSDEMLHQIQSGNNDQAADDFREQVARQKMEIEFQQQILETAQKRNQQMLDLFKVMISKDSDIETLEKVYALKSMDKVLELLADDEAKTVEEVAKEFIQKRAEGEAEKISKHSAEQLKKFEEAWKDICRNVKSSDGKKVLETYRRTMNGVRKEKGLEELPFVKSLQSGTFPEWAIVLIVIGGLALIGVGIGAFLYLKK